jgi:hypothetical protein
MIADRKPSQQEEHLASIPEWLEDLSQHSEDWKPLFLCTQHRIALACQEKVNHNIFLETQPIVSAERLTLEVGPCVER